ncbi:hypothetical protein AAHC03_022820 [Spirometra sp. Aus1]
MGGDKQALFVFKVGHSVHRKSKPTITKTHHWRCYVESWNKKYPLSAFVEKVTFKLHDTFENPKQIVRKAPFAIEEDGFGNFQLLIEVNFLDLLTSFTYDITLFERSELHAFRTVRLDPAPEDWPRFTRLGGIAIPVSATQADVQQLLRSIQATPNQEALHAYSFFPHLAEDPAIAASLTAPVPPDRGTISPSKNRPSREARSQALANLGKERLVLKLSISELESKGFRVSKKSKRERKYEGAGGGGGAGSGGSSSGGSISRRHKHRLRTTDSPAAISDQVASCTPSPARSAGGTARAPFPPLEPPTGPTPRGSAERNAPSATASPLGGRKRGAGGGKPAALAAALLSGVSAASPYQPKLSQQLPLPRKIPQPKVDQTVSPGISAIRTPPPTQGGGASQATAADPAKGYPAASAGKPGKRSRGSRDEVRHHRKSAVSSAKSAENSERLPSDKRAAVDARRSAKEEAAGEPFQNSTEEATMVWISRLNGGPQPLVSPLSPAASHSSHSEDEGTEQQQQQRGEAEGSDARTGSQRVTDASLGKNSSTKKNTETAIAAPPVGRGSSKSNSLKRPAAAVSEPVPLATAKRKSRKPSPQRVEPPPPPAHSPSAHSVSSADSSTPPMSVEAPCVEMPPDAQGRRSVAKDDERQQVDTQPEPDEGEVLCLDNDALELLFERLLRLEDANLAQRMGCLLLKYTANAGGQSKAGRRPAGAELLHTGPPAQMIAFDLRRLPLDCIIQLVELITEDESLAAAAAASANQNEAFRKPGSGTAVSAKEELAAAVSGKTQTAKEMTLV